MRKQREAREKDRRQNQKLITSSPRRLPAATKGAHPSGQVLGHALGKDKATVTWAQSDPKP
jgi:hypothetical protein